jgi:hypothetical protein
MLSIPDGPHGSDAARDAMRALRALKRPDTKNFTNATARRRRRWRLFHVREVIEAEGQAPSPVRGYAVRAAMGAELLSCSRRRDSSGRPRGASPYLCEAKKFGIWS